MSHDMHDMMGGSEADRQMAVIPPEEQPPVRVRVPKSAKRFPMHSRPSMSDRMEMESTSIGTFALGGPMSTGMKLRLKYVHITAKAACYVYLRFHNHADMGNRICPAYMAANSVVNANLTGADLEGDSDEVLEYVSDSAVQVSVMVIVESIPARVVGEPEQE